MTEPVLCGASTPNGPCTRKVLAGNGQGCGFHPAPAEATESDHPEAAPSCRCDQPLVLENADGDPSSRCFWCTKLVTPRPAPATNGHGHDPAAEHNKLIARLGKRT